MNSLFKLSFLFFLLFCCGTLSAQNKTISIQSTLKTIAGGAVPDGEQMITFRLYNSETGGTEVWSETATVEVTGGIYSHELGSVTALDISDFADQLFLGIQLGTGAELVPRTKLGHAPYTFAVIGNSGQSASFNSSGHFEVSGGFIANSFISSNNILTVGGESYFSDDVNASSNVNVQNKLAIGFSPSSVDPPYHVTIGDDDTGIDYVGSDELSIETGGVSRVVIKPDGKIGIGTSNPNTRLTVDGQHVTVIAGTGGAEYALVRTTVSQFDSGIIPAGNNMSSTVVADFDGTVLGDAFLAATNYTFSDIRVKDNLKKSDSRHDLSLLNKIEITEYDYIDQVKNDNRTQKKVIAQQVQQVLPNAVSTTSNVTPSIFENAVNVLFDGGKLTLTTNKAHQLSVGDKIDIVTTTGLKSALEVIDIQNATTFSVLFDEQPEHVFVYGKYVDDFLVVDYDAIAMLNVSATQELYRKIVDLERENIRLKNENKSLSTGQKELGDRLTQLEKMFSSNHANQELVHSNEK